MEWEKGEWDWPVDKYTHCQNFLCQVIVRIILFLDL